MRQSAAKSAGAKFMASPNIGYDKADVVLRQLAQGGANFIVAHASGYDTVATRSRPAVQGADDHLRRPTKLTRPRLVHHHVEPAGRVPRRHPRRPDDEDPQGRHHHLGVGRQLVQEDRRLRGGVPQRRSEADLPLRARSARRTTTPPAASGSRNSVIAPGADVIFAMGDDASFGYLQAIETAKPPATRSGSSTTSAT